MDAAIKTYEVAYLISPEVAEDEVFGEAGKITSAIQDAHGLVGHIEEPKQQRLAYPIQKKKAAYFGWTTFTTAKENLPEIEKKLKQEKNIIRYLIVEEVKRPIAPIRPARPAGPRRVPPKPIESKPITPFIPAAPKEEDKAKIEELDKKLEEILGK